MSADDAAFVPVSRPDLPPLDRYVAGLERIWARRQLSNGGPNARDLESRLSAHCDGLPARVVANGALALELALEGLGITGDVVTTPFTFVATANAIRRMGCTPVFADIEPRWFTLDPAAAERAITPATQAILAVHIFGIPCDLEGLAAVARRHGIALIYDAAHAFSVRVEGRAIADFGDVTMFSLHATKPYHSAEGGLLVMRDASLHARIAALVNHGLDDRGVVAQAGTNAKMSELHALMGLLMLDGVEERRARRAAIAGDYRARLADVPGLTLPNPPPSGVVADDTYFPICVDASRFGMTAGALKAGLAALGIGSRRYFHPPLHRMPAYPASIRLPVAEAISDTVLALPIGASFTDAEVRRVWETVRSLAP